MEAHIGIEGECTAPNLELKKSIIKKSSTKFKFKPSRPSFDEDFKNDVHFILKFS